MWIVILLSLVAIAIAPFIQPPWILALIAILTSAVFYFIKKTHYPAIGISVVAVLYGAEMVSLMVFLATIAIVMMGEAAFRICSSEKYNYLAYLFVASVSSVAVMGYLNYQNILIPLTGIIVAALLKSVLKNREDALMIECIGAAMTMFLFEDISYSATLDLILLAIIISFTFGYLSYKMKAADLSGLFSGALMGILIIVFSDITWFFVMLTFFVMGTAFTKYKYEKKKAEGLAESRGGARGFMNVFANGLVSLCAAVLFGIYQHPAFVALFLGSIAAATADTTASELGMLGKTPYLITTFEKVPKGTDGGITIFGEAAATAAAFVLCLAAFAMGVIPPDMVIIGTLAGFVGTNIDSLVGATLERNGTLKNAGTNFFCTLGGGIFAMLFYLF
ncbi:TIGR00297 family protein [Methanoplanus sp. FWC-SCC4]|uniref:TIGR00297 family protein n=2 Tax=Methanochimaera problematica TaxID=2609417 RepID=A0AA97I3E7_9EURY|nr:TIGR00297 family protein [Methanoplanus sp. FWC-SCC4]